GGEGGGGGERGGGGADGEQTVELDARTPHRRRLPRPDRGQPLLGEQREVVPRRGRRQAAEEALQVAVTGVADDPHVHRGERLSCDATARIRAAIAEAVSPAVSSWLVRGACS